MYVSAFVVENQFGKHVTRLVLFVEPNRRQPDQGQKAVAAGWRSLRLEPEFWMAFRREHSFDDERILKAWHRSCGFELRLSSPLAIAMLL